jgi:hypothetical protein
MKYERKQIIHSKLNAQIELAKRARDKQIQQELEDIRAYINHLEARVLGLEKTKDGLMEKLEKRYGKY